GVFGLASPSSRLPAARRRPSGLRATLVSSVFVAQGNSRNSLAVAVSHTLTVCRSKGQLGTAPTAARRWPSPLKATAPQPPRVRATLPVAGSQTLTRPRPSDWAAEARRPSGLNATPVTGGVRQSACPRKAKASWPVVTSQTLTVSPRLDVARRLPSGLKATL